MFKLHVVDWSNRIAYRDDLVRFFRIRHEIYVETRNWRQIERPIPLEIDAFDTRHAIYLLGKSPEGEVVAGSRLVPTCEPHLLSDVFPMLAADGPPRDADTYEWTRFFIAPSLRQSGRSARAAGIVLCGLLEACLQRRIAKLSVVCEAFWPQRLQQLGWSITQLGPAADHPDGRILALLIEVSHDALNSTRKAYGLVDESVLAPVGQGGPS